MIRDCGINHSPENSVTAIAEASEDDLFIYDNATQKRNEKNQVTHQGKEKPWEGHYEPKYEPSTSNSHCDDDGYISHCATNRHGCSSKGVVLHENGFGTLLFRYF